MGLISRVSSRTYRPNPQLSKKMNVNPNFVEGFHENKWTNRQYNKLGETDMFVSSISLGTSAFGNCYGHGGRHVISYDTCENITLTAIRDGHVNYIDCAPWYGQGAAEAMLARVLTSGKIPRAAYYLATKVGRYDPEPEKMFDFSYDRTIQTVESQLKLYQTDHIDVIQVHDPEYSTKKDDNGDGNGKFVIDRSYRAVIEECLPALKKLQEQGKVRYIGINGYPFYIYEQIVNNSPVKIDTIFTYAHLTFMEQGFVKFITELRARNEKFKNIGVINAGVTCLGLFTTQGVQDWYQGGEEVRKLGKQAVKIAEKYRLNISMLALKYDQLEMGQYKATSLIGNCKVSEAEANFIDTTKTEFQRWIGQEKECVDEILALFKDVGPTLTWEQTEEDSFCALMNA